MADSGDLGKLPPEIRKEIYAYLLVEPIKIGILCQETKQKRQVARFDHHRNKKHRGKFYDRGAREWKSASPSILSLLLVNKLVGQEAAQVLYGLNAFEFLHAAALECFLKHIGPSRQYLRSIELVGQGVLFSAHWSAMDRSLKLLTQTPSLRSLEISHLAFCGQYGTRSAEQWIVTPKALVQHCKPLLESLKTALEDQNLSLRITDVIKVTLPRCGLDFMGMHEEFHEKFWGHERLLRTFPAARKKSSRESALIRCNCICNEAEEKNRGFIKGVKDEITKQLGPSIDDGHDEDAE